MVEKGFPSSPALDVPQCRCDRCFREGKLEKFHTVDLPMNIFTPPFLSAYDRLVHLSCQFPFPACLWDLYNICCTGVHAGGSANCLYIHSINAVHFTNVYTRRHSLTYIKAIMIIIWFHEPWVKMKMIHSTRGTAGVWGWIDLVMSSYDPEYSSFASQTAWERCWEWLGVTGFWNRADCSVSNSCWRVRERIHLDGPTGA